ncbi:hypothetical protein H4R26_003206 [Coemansia thaxteri]|uniref:Cytochrome b5 heme-binding domain-containing protein n=1 Tax=Coemansia thaxteri TaxID=2663907 RepID=A0A9W8BF08_9FUNG|nr:hypothetical protein H4R26_003206 [Coemansia thaxteri]KAJ2472791.1 hypothetical protein EV174_005782 [Coemansia sp. RSA 2320]
MATKEFTLRKLEKYTGQNKGESILLGLNGSVYDVTTGAAFYGPGKGYSIFAGRDCTIGLARSSLLRDVLPGPDDAPTNIDDLSESERDTVMHWQQRLDAKYPVVGVLVKEEGQQA